MEDLTKLSDTELTDFLNFYISIYRSRVTDWQVATEQYEQCKEAIKQLQQEIEYRHRENRFG